MFGILKEKLLAKLREKKYRNAYVAAQATTGIAYQIRALREQQNLTQEALGRRLGKPQNAISRLEDPDYGRLTVKSLTELAAAFDIAVLIKFVSFSKFLTETADKSAEGLRVATFAEELPTLEFWASEDRTGLRVSSLELGPRSAAQVLGKISSSANESTSSLAEDCRRIAA